MHRVVLFAHIAENPYFLKMVVGKKVVQHCGLSAWNVILSY
jgi:hypothetical protein